MVDQLSEIATAILAGRLARAIDDVGQVLHRSAVDQNSRPGQQVLDGRGCLGVADPDGVAVGE